MATLFVDKLDPQSGTALEIGSSGDTITIPSGATITNSGTANNFGGITEADNWRISSAQSISADTDTVVNSSWERNDNNSDKIGTGLTESSGIFTFPSTGIYLISYQQNVARSGDSRYFIGSIFLSTNSGSSSSAIARSYASIKQVTGETSSSSSTSSIIDVTNASTFRLSFQAVGDEAFTLRASSTDQITGFYCIKLGDT